MGDIFVRGDLVSKLLKMGESPINFKRVKVTLNTHLEFHSMSRSISKINQKSPKCIHLTDSNGFLTQTPN